MSFQLLAVVMSKSLDLFGIQVHSGQRVQPLASLLKGKLLPYLQGQCLQIRADSETGRSFIHDVLLGNGDGSEFGNELFFWCRSKGKGPKLAWNTSRPKAVH